MSKRRNEVVQKGKKIIRWSHFFRVYGVVGHLGIEPDDERANGRVILLDEELHHEQVQHRHAEHDSPENRMRPRERPIGKGQGRDDQKEEDHPA